MSAPQNEAQEVPLEKMKGFEKYVERFKKAIKGSSSSSRAQKRLSVAAAGSKPAPVAGSSAAAASSSKDAAKPAAAAAAGEPTTTESTKFPKKIDSDEAPINVVVEKADKYRLQITKPPRTSKQELVLKKPVQRVRRNCHCCGTLFYPPTKTCTECGHIRCTDCPRDPPKLDKYPYGYPNDVFGDKTAYYTCHSCENVFPLDESKCLNCTHEKCTECARAPPRKIEPQPDPEVLRRVEEKLAQLALGSSAAAKS
ncbi:hypothetical protein V496_08029 [Pseudogymnoascus sp. VKM F-4515 (FW-2607)]|nr:hypothetical protein V496_08029 [Pseudogymnoascus sp. VKM F-4515 (FW-2607)]KFY69388.1 hypothetical protein V498_10480 [Pseudogymnoascus sp. VKM F-4517 (FW-2822)]